MLLAPRVVRGSAFHAAIAVSVTSRADSDRTASRLLPGSGVT
jgi:hypothetical protein